MTSFDASLGFADSTAVIRLAGRVDDRAVPVLHDLLEQAAARTVRHVRLEATGLDLLGAAGARCLAFAQQHLPPGAEMSVAGASEAVRTALRAAGLSGTVTFVERSMSLPEPPQAPDVADAA